MRISDWSSDVCSSDLIDHRQAFRRAGPYPRLRGFHRVLLAFPARRRWPTRPARRHVLLPSELALRRRPHRCRHRSEEHTSELQSLMRISYAVLCLKKKNNNTTINKNDREKNKA